MNSRIQEWDEDQRLVMHPPAPGWTGGVSRLSESFVERKLDTSLIPQDFETAEALQMSLAQIGRKAKESPEQSVWAIRYWSRFAYAGTNFTLVLLGLPVIVFFANRNILFGAIVALVVATAYFVSNSVCQDLGIQGHLPAALAAGFAPIFFISLGATLYKHMRS